MARNIFLLMIFTGAVYLILDNFTTKAKRGYIDSFVSKNVPAKIGLLGV